jgi:predicted dehydrogenase
MDIVTLGDGPRLAAWIKAARAHPRVRSIAAVSRGEAGSDAAGNAVRRYSTLQSACTEVKPSAALLTGSAALDGPRAIEALNLGLDVILDRAEALDVNSLTKLVAIARSRKRLVILALEDASGRTAKRLSRLVRNVGPISHVSYIDRRPRSDIGDVSDSALYAQLIRFGLDQIESLRSLFDARPVRVMARYTESRSATEGGATAELMLELERNIHVQYFGSTRAGHREQSLWVEGKAGSLRSEGAHVWWRKRGWPRFVPWRWWPVAAASDTRLVADSTKRTLDLLAKVASGGAAAEEARRAASDRLALLGSVMRSNQDSRIVDVGDWERPAG